MIGRSRLQSVIWCYHRQRKYHKKSDEFDSFFLSNKKVMGLLPDNRSLVKSWL